MFLRSRCTANPVACVYITQLQKAQLDIEISFNFSFWFFFFYFYSSLCVATLKYFFYPRFYFLPSSTKIQSRLNDTNCFIILAACCTKDKRFSSELYFQFDKTLRESETKSLRASKDGFIFIDVLIVSGLSSYRKIIKVCSSFKLDEKFKMS